MPLSVVLVDGTYRVVPLPVLGEIAQDVALRLCTCGLQLSIQTHIVYSPNAYYGEFIVRIDTILVLHLKVVVSGEDGELHRLKEPLQVRLTSRGDERGLTPQRSLYSKPCIRSSHGSIDAHAVGITVTLLDLHNRAECIASTGGESARVEVDLSDKVGVDYPNDTSGSSLGRKVIDHGDLDTIKVKDILRGSPTTHDEVIAIEVCRSYPRQSLHELGDISIRPCTLLDLLEAECLYRERTLGTLKTYSGADNYL